jgi:hypothetical protein
VGEQIRLQAAFRSTAARPAGDRTIQLTHPSGEIESLSLADPGTPWFAAAFELSAERTRRLAPGKYQLNIAGLPEHIVAVPLAGIPPDSGVADDPLFVINPLTGSLYDEQLYSLVE